MDTDQTIMNMAEKLYRWSEDENIDLLVQKDTTMVGGEHTPIYYCLVILTTGNVCNFMKVKDWEIRQVLCTGSGYEVGQAKQDLLNRMMEKARDALAVPVEEVMES